MNQEKSCIKKATIEDLGEITSILNQAIRLGDANAYTKTFTHAERVDWLKENSCGKYAVYVYKHTNRVFGYINIGPYRKGRDAFSNTAEVSYYVDFKYHRKGIATELMKKALEHCRKNGIKTLLAFIYDHNEPSIKFLKKFGFDQWGLFPQAAESKGRLLNHVIYGLKIDKKPGTK